MSMKADTDGKAYDDINVTPMVDLYLVLLLIFIIMTTAGLQGFKAHLPKESANSSQAKNQIITIVVTNSGQITWNKLPLSLGDVDSRLAAAKARTPDLHVVLRGEPQAPYKGVLDVLNVITKEQIQNLSLATK
jgi:biopolymer transport protein ExbD